MDLDAAYRGFRERYLGYDELTAQIQAWAEGMPEVVRLTSLARTPEGREVWLLEIGRDPDRIRPAAWIDGNIHASELCGSSVCLHIVEELLRAFAGAPLVDLPAHVRELLCQDVLFYVLPRMCPDGAERVLTRHHFVRSNWREARPGNHGPYWRHDDVDGDGLSLLMRVPDPTGDFVASAEVAGLMLPRRVEDEGPFYRVYPEGQIERWDGFTIPRPHFMSDSETDMNRNFASDWRPEPEQLGAGKFPGSEPESRAVMEFSSRRPNIFAWACMHTYGGVFIRPLNGLPDSKMDPFDQAVFRQLEQWGDEIVGYPTVSGFHEFTYEPDKPLYGELANFAYVERGAIGFVCELWDFFKAVGFEVKRPFIKNYEVRNARADIVKMAEWDRAENAGRMIGGWRPFDHPQLGPVEIGGYDPLIGVWNPPYERLAGICRDQARFFFRLAALAPRLRIRDAHIAELGGGLFEVSAVVENWGFLPTYFLGSARSRSYSDPVRAELVLSSGVALVSGDRECELGALMGWGGNDRSTSPMLARSTVEPGRRRVRWVVKGAGSLTIRAACARVGEVTLRLSMP